MALSAGTKLGPYQITDQIGAGGMGREITAVTETPCEILWLRRSDFRRLADDSPRTACRLLEAIASEFAGCVRRELDTLKS